jgi:hypothetical protein
MKTVAQTEHTQVVTGAKRYNAERLVIHQTKHLDPRAEFAAQMIRTWGIVAGRPADTGEAADERGVALLSPAELVSRACEITDLAMAEFERRGWVVNLPAYEQLSELDD